MVRSLLARFLERPAKRSLQELSVSSHLHVLLPVAFGFPDQDQPRPYIQFDTVNTLRRYHQLTPPH